MSKCITCHKQIWFFQIRIFDEHYKCMKDRVYNYWYKVYSYDKSQVRP